MKYATITFLIIFSFYMNAFAADENDFKRKYMSCIKDADLDIEDENITIHDDDNTIEITSDYELYVNGKYVKTNSDQKRILREYHTMVFELIYRAKDIGLEGAKLGVD